MASKKQFPLSIVIGAVDKVTAPLLRVRQKIQRFMTPMKRLQKSINRLGRAAGFKVMGAAIGRAGKAAGNLAGKIGAVGGALAKFSAIASVATGIATKMFLDFTAAGRETAAWAARIGIGVETLQELQYATGQYNVTQDALIDGLKELTLRADEFVVTGKGSAAEAFQRLRIGADDLRKTGGDAEKMLELVSSRIRQVDNAAARQRIADELFGGQGGEQFTEFLTVSADEIARLRKESQELGYVMSQDTAKATVKFDQGLRRMRAAISGVRNIIGAALIPVVQDLAAGFTKFITENRGAITQWAKNFAAAIPTFEQLKRSVNGFMDELRPLLNLLKWINETVGLVNAVLIVMATVMGSQLVIAIGGLVLAFNALGIAILATPIGWVLAGIAAIAAGAYLLYKNWETIAPKIAKVFNMFNPFKLWTASLEFLINKFTSFDFGGKVRKFFGWLPGVGGEESSRPRLMPAGSSVIARGAAPQSTAKVTVDFNNLPQGARVTQDPRSDADLSLGMGYSMMGVN